ncbi:hypothetical protein EJ110_NYTH23490 [Nymphaea thermarum]|nr:hypothetical protein EJ110_NYTH23490 [Nymphaea thermarum]
MAEEITPKSDVAFDTGSAAKSENLPVQVTSIRLTKYNYLSWSAALEIGITSRGRLPYITGDKPAPSKTDPQWATWALEDSQVKVWIISSVSADIQPLILRRPTSFDMWNVLAMIPETKWEELDYHVNDNRDCGPDHARYWEKEWMDQTFLFLGGLRDEFESIRNQILNCDEIPGIEDVYARVESEEQRRQVMHIDSSPGSGPSAFVSRSSVPGQRPWKMKSFARTLSQALTIRFYRGTWLMEKSREVPALLFIPYPLLFITYPLLFITYPTLFITVHARRSCLQPHPTPLFTAHRPQLEPPSGSAWYLSALVSASASRRLCLCPAPPAAPPDASVSVGPSSARRLLCLCWTQLCPTSSLSLLDPVPPDVFSVGSSSARRLCSAPATLCAALATFCSAPATLCSVPTT